MNQHLHLITLGVKDFEKSRGFYAETLGWEMAHNQFFPFDESGNLRLN